MEITEEKGTVELIRDTQVISDKFKKREFVINTGGEYAQVLLFQLVQDKVTEIDNYKVGDAITVSYNLKGRKWTNKEGVDKYFNTLEAWRVQTNNDVVAPSPEAAQVDTDLPF